MFDFTILDDNPLAEEGKRLSLIEEAFVIISDDEEPFADEEAAWLKNNVYAPDLVA